MQVFAWDLESGQWRANTCHTFCHPAAMCHTASLSVNGPYFCDSVACFVGSATGSQASLVSFLSGLGTSSDSAERCWFLWGFVLDMTVLHFCSASPSQQTWLVKNLNQIGESQQSSSPPLFDSAPLPPGQGNRQSWGATTKLFPEPISCWTVCYTLSNIPKIILTSKAALIWPPPSLLPSLCWGARLQD